VHSELTFLYVEDDSYSREVMKILLHEILGYATLTIFDDSANFEARLDGLTYVPDIIFLDIHVDPLTGFEMLKIIRQHPRIKNARVIALTASVMATEVDDLRSAGFDGLVAKPLNQSEFPSMVERIARGEIIWDELWD